MIALAFAILASAGAAIASDSAFTDYEQIVDAAFPASKMLKKARKPSVREAKVLANVRDVVVTMIETTGMPWLKPLTVPHAPTPTQWRSVLDVMRRTPVWICDGSCAGTCNSDRTVGCVGTKEFGDSVASFVAFAGCAMEPEGCPLPKGSRDTRPVGGTALIFELTKEMLTTVAYRKVNTLVGNDKKLEDASILRAMKAIEVSSMLMGNLLRACPGPFPQEGLGYLKSTGHLKAIGPFADECGKRYLQPFRASPLPKECQLIADPRRWKDVLARGMLWDEPEFIRCDSFCEFTTCGNREAPSPRAALFGAKWVVSLPVGACDGAKPGDPRRFVENILPLVMKQSLLEVRGGEGLMLACARALTPGASSGTHAPSAPVETPSRQDSGSGPDVELVE